MRRAALILVVLMVAAAGFAQEATKAQPLLPSQFAGWEKRPQAKTSREAAEADTANAQMLREYGFQEFEQATYAKPQRKMAVKAARFADASGAYGAFTVYKKLGMLTEAVGDQGASADLHVLFYRGNVLVDVVLDRVTAMSAAELRELSQNLSLGASEMLKLPTLPAYLPKQSLVTGSERYLLGPAGYAAAGGTLPTELIDFGRSAEVVLGQYESSRGPATLTLIGYPTPQIAAERLRAMEAYARPGGSATPAPEVALAAKRTGPIVAVVTGDIPRDEASSLLASVNYDAEVTWSEATGLSKRDNIGNLVMAAFMLTGIIFLFALVLGLMFGGFRLLMKKLFPDQVFDRAEDVEIIQLHLRR